MTLNNENKLTGDNNYKELLSQGVHIVELTGDQCSSCIAMNPIIHNLIAKHSSINYHYLVATHNTVKMCEEFEVTKIPCILLVHEGALLGKVAGYQPEEILEIWLDTELEKIETK